MEKATIDDRLENAASYGEMGMGLFLWKKSIERLRKNGLVVTEVFASKRKGEVYCQISWEEAGEVEESSNPTQASHLYTMAKQANAEKAGK